jgi:superfamily I DNA and/or RNA helicase
LIEGIDVYTIGIITKEKIKRINTNANSSIDIDTVNGYQGMEKDLIIISFVRLNNLIT